MRNAYSYPTRDPIKNYFPLPNEIFMLGLTPGELAVYSFLMRCENRKTFQCHPSYATIGEAVNLSKNSVRKCVQGLCEKQLITTEPTTVVTRSGEKRNGSLCYTLRPVEEAIRFHVEQQRRQAEEQARQQRMQEKLNAFASARGDVLLPGQLADAAQETQT